MGGAYCSARIRSSLKALQAKLQEQYELTANFVGRGPDEDLEGQILNRIVRYTDDGFEFECDPRHCELIVEQL